MQHKKDEDSDVHRVNCSMEAPTVGACARRARNRKAASECRERKKRFYATLERENHELREENTKLLQRQKDQEAELSVLRAQENLVMQKRIPDDESCVELIESFMDIEDDKQDRLGLFKEETMEANFNVPCMPRMFTCK